MKNYRFHLENIIGAARRRVPNAGARLVSPVISMSLERLTSLPMSANATTNTVAATITRQRISFGSILMNRNHSGRSGNRKPEPQRSQSVLRLLWIRQSCSIHCHTMTSTRCTHSCPSRLAGAMPEGYSSFIRSGLPRNGAVRQFSGRWIPTDRYTQVRLWDMMQRPGIG